MWSEIPWSSERFVDKMAAVHRLWKRDRRAGKGAGFHFNRTYCTRRGMGRGIQLARESGVFDALLARCPPEVSADWRNDARPEWTASLIRARILEMFAHWKEHGASRGRKWNQRYFEMNGAAGMIRSLDRLGLRVEYVVRQLGGEVAASWTRGWFGWDASRMRTLIREAYALWQSDREYGRPTGHRFSTFFLMRRGYSSRLRPVERHVRGGLNAFVRAMPDIAPDWYYRSARPSRELRDELRGIFKRWRRDEEARAACVRFGPAYIFAIGHRSLHTAMTRRGIRRFLAHPDLRAVRAAWGRSVPGSQTQEHRRRRAEYFSRVRSSARLTT